MKETKEAKTKNFIRTTVISYLHGCVSLFGEAFEIFARFYPHGHGLVDFLDGFLMLALYFGQSLLIVILLSKCLVPLPDGLSALLLELVAFRQHVLVQLLVPQNLLLKRKQTELCIA